ncbi:Exonuclease 1 [Paramuricea clavata]|uniref:Exonuclease 1 n=1 Tax=Paramuricea clavata TaxID=317549 RepID=A0A7D9JLB7_PARCT|nr:Exonuclease 1 [Paramuricea clavata]
MGINCLFPYLKTYSKEVNIAAVDASCWIHKGSAILVSQTGKRERQRQEQLMKATVDEQTNEEDRNKMLSWSVEMNYDVVECVKIEWGWRGFYDILDGLKVTMAQFVDGCVAAGCDYLKNICGVGINQAFSFVKAGTLFDELRKKGASNYYESLFNKAVSVFMHQTVFNPTKLHVQPLRAWSEDPDKEL